LSVTIIQHAYDANLSWNLVENYPDSSVTFSLYLNDSLVASKIRERNHNIEGLRPVKVYNGRVDAIAEIGLIASGSFEFTTANDLPPADFEITTTVIRNHSVTLKWSPAADPEGGPVTYDVYLENKLKSGSLSSMSFTFDSLNILTYYNGKIVATDTAGNTMELSFFFRTIHPDNSVMAHTYEQFQGRRREYTLYLPKSYPEAGSPPLVIFLHGANGNAWNQMQTSYFREIADRENFIFLMPQALLGTYNGESVYQWNAHYIFSWDDAAFISQLIDSMHTAYNADLSRIYIGGMSNGGFMTFFAAKALQDKVAAIAPIAGLMSTNIYTGYTLCHLMPLCYMHGTADNIVTMNGNPSLNDVLNLWININGCNSVPEVTELPDLVQDDNSTVTLFRYTGTSDDSEILYYQINGGGHSIPGIEYGANMDINAFEEMWKFFKRHIKH
jgi:polyhydroxybutyrate depolymerase